MRKLGIDIIKAMKLTPFLNADGQIGLPLVLHGLPPVQPPAIYGADPFIPPRFCPLSGPTAV